MPTPTIEHDIFDCLKELHTDKSFSSTALSASTLELIKSTQATENSESYVNVGEPTYYESKSLGICIPRWINPLRFEFNLNQALDALEDAEMLFAEYQGLVSTELTHHYFESRLKGSERKDYVDIASRLDIEGSKENVELRFAHKIIDLLRFTMAAKLGAFALYKITNEQIDLQPNIEGISRIRESLRTLLALYRPIQAKQVERIISISLKHGMKFTEDGTHTYLSADKVVERRHLTQFKERTIDFDMRKALAIQGYSSLIIKDVGIQIVDDNSIRVAEKYYGEVDSWNIHLTDKGNGKLLHENIAPDYYTIDPLFFSSIQANKDTLGIKWSNSSRVSGLNPNREWSVMLPSHSHHRHAFDHSSGQGIIDVIVHFKVLAIGAPSDEIV